MEPNTIPAPDFSLEKIAAWLRTKPAHETYVYSSRDNCLLAQYLRGAPNLWVGGWTVRIDDASFQIPETVQNVTEVQPFTFGDALARCEDEIANATKGDQ